MAFTAGFRARVVLGDFSLSTKATDVSLPVSVDMLDISTLADEGVKRTLPGLTSSSFSVDGFIDAAVLADAEAWTSATPLTYAPTGLTLGYPVITVDALKASFEPGTQVGGVASFSLSGQSDGVAGFGVSLHDLTAVIADESGTGVDGGAATTAGGHAHLHVTAFSGFTSAVVIVEDSANNSTWATIGTFATATGVTGERLAIAGTIRRYTRYSIDVTGTGSVTFAVALSRN